MVVAAAAAVYEKYAAWTTAAGIARTLITRRLIALRIQQALETMGCSASWSTEGARKVDRSSRCKKDFRV